MKNLFNDLSSKELKNKCGIYLINIMDHYYVGSSKSLYSRLSEHRGDLKTGKHNNTYLRNAYIKYGIDRTWYKIIEFCEPEIRIKREKFWIKELNAQMNMQDPVTKELSQSSRDKISTSLKKAYKTGKKIKPVGQSIEMYDLSGKFLQEFPSAELAAESMKMNTHTIQIAASKYYAGRTCGFYRFRYKSSKVLPRKFTYSNTNKLVSKFNFLIIEPDGNEISVKLGIKNINNAVLEQLFKGNLEFKIKGIPKVPVKQGELLENPQSVDNQQPSLESNLLEGSTTNLRVQSGNTEDSNENKSALPLHTGILDSNPNAFK